MKKKKFSWKGLSILLLIVLVLAGVAAPHYVWTVERAKAGAAEAALINLSVAENLYFIHHKTYTYDWRELDRYMPQMEGMQGVFAPAGEEGEERFFSFSEKELSRARSGYSFGVELDESRTSGKIYAVRTGGILSYTLTESFPKPAFVCEAGNAAGKWFCNKFSDYILPFLMRKKEDASVTQTPAH